MTPVRRAWSLAGSHSKDGPSALAPVSTPAGMVLGGPAGAQTGQLMRAPATLSGGPFALTISRAAHEHFVAGEPTESETTEECHERIQQLGEDLFAMGCEPEEVHYSQLSVNYMRDLKDFYRDETRNQGC